METVNIHQAKTNLSRLIEKAVNGEDFIIAKAGKPLVKVTRIDHVESAPVQRVGFMKDKIRVPENFDRMGDDEIANQFAGH
jgi:prevent-host-death family protein